MLSLRSLIYLWYTLVLTTLRFTKSAQDRAKHYADEKRFFLEFEVGDRVFLKVAPKQSELKLGKSRKLSPRFCSPFESVKRIGQLAYELKLPDDWQIHNVFHVGLL